MITSIYEHVNTINAEKYDCIKKKLLYTLEKDGRLSKGTVMSIFGERLRAVRCQRGYTLRALGVASGVPYEPIARLESGAHRSPRGEAIVALCRTLGVSADYLLGITDRQPGVLRRRHSTPDATVERMS